MSFWSRVKSFFKHSNESNSSVIPNSSVVIKPIDPIPEIPTSEDELSLIQVNASAVSELNATVLTIKQNIAKYKYVETMTGVPWDVVASCHYRESSLSFKGCLHNGDPWNKKTTHVPKGRGPFNSWEESAVDAMMIEKNKFPQVWDLQGKLDFCERYNGLGYRNRGIPSPYVWASTNKYKSGLYTGDSEFSSSKVDKRLGCAAIIKGLRSS